MTPPRSRFPSPPTVTALFAGQIVTLPVEGGYRRMPVPEPGLYVDGDQGCYFVPAALAEVMLRQLKRGK